MSPLPSKPSELYTLWAPPHSVWSQWAKPALFSCTVPHLPTLTPIEVPTLPFSIEEPQRTVLVVDLPRAESIRTGLALARNGFRPVPLFNCVNGPSPTLHLGPMLDLLAHSMAEVRSWNLPHNAPPAFLLDSKRMSPDKPLTPGNFDNRYFIFPQDFPSGGFLKTQGIDRVLIIQEELNTNPKEDLLHVLLRWEQSGLPIHLRATQSPAEDKILKVPRPGGFRSLFYRAMAIAGLKRNSAGGFGGIIPQPSSGG